RLGPSRLIGAGWPIAFRRGALISSDMLTLRPTNLETSPVYAHLKDYTVFEDGVEIGRMYEQRPGATPDALWLWSITVIVPGPRRGKRAGRAANLGAAGPFAGELGSFRGCWRGLGFQAGLIYIPLMPKRSPLSELPCWRITRIRGTPAAEIGTVE